MADEQTQATPTAEQTPPQDGAGAPEAETPQPQGYDAVNADELQQRLADYQANKIPQTTQYIMQNLPPEFVNELGEYAQRIIEVVLTLENDFLEQEIYPKQQQLQEKQVYDVIAAKCNENGIDTREFLQFWMNDLSPAEQQKLGASNDINATIDGAIQLFKERRGMNAAQPPQMAEGGTPTEAEDFGGSDDYLSRE